MLTRQGCVYIYLYTINSFHSIKICNFENNKIQVIPCYPFLSKKYLNLTFSVLGWIGLQSWVFTWISLHSSKPIEFLWNASVKLYLGFLNPFLPNMKLIAERGDGTFQTDISITSKSWNSCAIKSWQRLFLLRQTIQGTKIIFWIILF